MNVSEIQLLNEVLHKNIFLYAFHIIIHFKLQNGNCLHYEYAQLQLYMSMNI